MSELTLVLTCKNRFMKLGSLAQQLCGANGDKKKIVDAHRT